ncbi:MAG TPA: hypothetical protein VJU83_09675 [Burkholderiales bacterium]|nr:hypothetical protein [Burkholderiales bacterium]
MTLEAETVIEVLAKLVGPIDTVGDTHAYEKRFENLRVLTHVVDHFLTKIDTVAMDKNHHAYSVKRSGEFASKFLDQIGIVS